VADNQRRDQRDADHQNHGRYSTFGLAACPAAA